MKKTTTIVLCVIALLGLSVGAFFLHRHLNTDRIPNGQPGEATASNDETTSGDEAPSGNDAPPEDERPTAPDFTVYKRRGKAVQLSDFKGKPVVLNLWASWCGPCKAEMPAFEAAYREHGDDVHFLMVNLTEGRRETVKTARKFLRTTDYTFPVYYDTDSSAAMLYTSGSIPVTYFIDSQGRLVAYVSGAITAEMLAQGIAMITE